MPLRVCTDRDDTMSSRRGQDKLMSTLITLLGAAELCAADVESDVRIRYGISVDGVCAQLCMPFVDGCVRAEWGLRTPSSDAPAGARWASPPSARAATESSPPRSVIASGMASRHSVRGLTHRGPQCPQCHRRRRRWLPGSPP